MITVYEYMYFTGDPKGKRKLLEKAVQCKNCGEVSTRRLYLPDYYVCPHCSRDNLYYNRHHR